MREWAVSSELYIAHCGQMQYDLLPAAAKFTINHVEHVSINHPLVLAIPDLW